MLIVAHLSDIHLDLSARNEERAARVMAYLNDLPGPLDAVLVTGDLADHGLATEYEQVAKILTSPHRVLHCPGNHDDREPYREVLLGEAPSGGPINQAFEVGGCLFLLCDSTIPGKDEGSLDAETIDWIDRTLGLAEDDMPAFICFHHPPVVLHHPVIDEIRLHDEQRLAQLIRRHSRVVAVLCGHAHTAAATMFAGRPVRVAPGVVSTLCLPWEGRPSPDYELPPAIAFHVLDDNLRLTTHYRVVV
jgi:Icc protein